MDDLFVLLTVPHDPCPPFQPKMSHLCDTLAKRTAIEMKEILRSVGIDSKIMVATIHRVSDQGGSDQNRPEGSGSTFRQSIESLTQDMIRSMKIVFVIDMHSFSDATTKFGPAQVVIMDPVENIRSPPTSYVEDLMQFFKTKMKHAAPGYVKGGQMNAITVNARKDGAISFLVETRERSTKSQREQTWKALAEWIADFSETGKKKAKGKSVLAISW